MQLLNLFCLWNQFEERVKAFALIGSAQPTRNYNFTALSSKFTKFNDLSRKTSNFWSKKELGGKKRAKLTSLKN